VSGETLKDVSLAAIDESMPSFSKFATYRMGQAVRLPPHISLPAQSACAYIGVDPISNRMRREPNSRLDHIMPCTIANSPSLFSRGAREGREADLDLWWVDGQKVVEVERE